LENRYHEKTLELVNAELIEHRVHLQSLVQKRTNSLEKAKLKLVKTLEKTIKTLAMTVELRDPYTAGHQYRVATLAEALAKQLNLSAEKTHEIYLGALIHDIGKIQVPQEILTSPCQLTPLQFEYIKTHPEAGYKIIQPISLGATISNIILHHHERLDGSGYPHGLKGAEIPLPTRIVSVADVFEAMSSHRPYRPKHSIKATLAELKHGAGKIYDSSVVNCCIKMITEDGFIFPIVPYSQLFSHSK
jgi:putative nucleotidyltransferase with HDIG domain